MSGEETLQQNTNNKVSIIVIKKGNGAILPDNSPLTVSPVDFARHLPSTSLWVKDGHWEIQAPFNWTKPPVQVSQLSAAALQVKHGD